MSRFTRSLALIGLALLPACGSDPISPRPPVGTYEATVTGDLSRSMRGGATIVIGTTGYGGKALSIHLGDERAADRIVLTIAGDARPPVGMYDIGAGSEPEGDVWIGGYLVHAGNQQIGYFTPLGGLVKITHSSPDRLVGIFAFDAAGVFGEEQNVGIVIEGSFDARFVPTS